MKNTFLKRYIAEENNIYLNSKLDGVLYIIIYLVIPLATILIGLLGLLDSELSQVYWYATILVSVVGCLYDCTCRWEHDRKSIKNLKILLMGTGAFIVLAYCIVEMILIFNDGPIKLVEIFFAYCLTAGISTIDVVSCFMREITIGECIDLE